MQFNKQLWSIDRSPGSGLGTRNTKIDKTKQVSRQTEMWELLWSTRTESQVFSLRADKLIKMAIVAFGTPILVPFVTFSPTVPVLNQQTP